MAGLLWYRSYMDSLANTSGYYPDIHAGHADRVTELTLDAPYLVRETPAGYNKLELSSIIGGSVAWNQLFKPVLATSSQNGVTVTRDADGTMTLNGTCTSGGGIAGTPVANVQNHIYFMKGNASSDMPSGTTFSSQSYGVDSTGNGNIIKITSSSANWYFVIYVQNGVTYSGQTFRPIVIDLTKMFGSTIADYVYSLEQSMAGSGIAWLKNYDYFTEDYIAYSAPTLEHVKTTAHITKDADDNVLSTYPFDSGLLLRGVLKVENGALVYYGDTYEPDGTVTRYFGERAYQAGDESLTDAITDGTDTVYKLGAPTTESADPYTALQDVEEGGTEEFVTSNNVPVGNVSVYRRA